MQSLFKVVRSLADVTAVFRFCGARGIDIQHRRTSRSQRQS